MTIPHNNNGVNSTSKVYRTALDLIYRSYAVVAASGKRAVAKWEPLMNENPPRDVVEIHLSALRDGRADRIGLVNGIRNIVCIDIDAQSHDAPVDDLVVDDILVRLERPFVDEDEWSWRSLSGAGWHIWLTVPDLPDDVTREIVSSNAPGVRHIELRARGHYTIIPPNVNVPTTPPPEAPWATVLRAVGAPQKEKQAKTMPQATPPLPPVNGHRAVDAPSLPRAASAVSQDDTDVLAGWIDRVATAPEGTRNDTLVRAAFVAGRFVAAGLADRNAVERDLLNATTLPHREAVATIRSGLEAGMEKPWEPARKTRRSGAHSTSDAAPSTLIQAIAELGYRFAYNVETDQIMFTSPDISTLTLLTDVHVGKLRWGLREMKVRQIGALHDAVIHLAWGNRIAPIRDTLTALQWDGQPHIRRLASYLQVEDGVRPTLSEDWLTIWLLGAVRRVIDHVHNVVLVLEGAQGIGKSMFARWLASLDRSFYIEQVIDPHSRDCRLALTQHFIWEISEIDSITNRHDAAALKQFISAEVIDERAAYARYPTRLPALASFIATTNALSGYLTDVTGNRRFLPLPLKSIDWSYATTIDVRQVWAEAVARYRAGELDPLWSSVAGERAQLTEARRVRSLVDDWIDAYFVITNDPLHSLTSAEIVKELHNHNCSFGGTERSAAMAVSLALTARGLRKKRFVAGSTRTWRWVGIAVK